MSKIVIEKTNGHEEKSSKVLTYEDVCGSDKQLYLIKLPKELLKVKNLKFNLKDLKHGNKLKLDDKDYEGSVFKNKVDFSCLVRNEDYESKMTAGIIQLKRDFKIEEYKAPKIPEDRTVAEPPAIEQYLRRTKAQKRSLDHDELMAMADPGLRVKSEELSVIETPKKKHKKHKEKK